MNKFIQDIKIRKEYYLIAKNAKKLASVNCPSCGDTFVKDRLPQKFCSIKCKDNYWNNNKK